MRSRFLVWLLFGLLVVPVGAATLQDRTVRAFTTYAQEATRMFVQRARTDAASPQISLFDHVPHDGEVIARAGKEDGIVNVPDGLVHHWAGTTFIAGVTLENTLRVSYDYDDYHTIYKPVVASRLLSHNESSYQVLLRIKGEGGGVSAVLDVTSRVQYFFPNQRSAYSISTSEEIREIDAPGGSHERRLPEGHDSGYLWRAMTFTRFAERNDGVLIEMETLGLSRSFPPLLGWFIEPIARRLGRRSVELSLHEFSDAVHVARR